MNPFIKSNKPWLGLLGLAIIIVFLAFLFRPKTIDFEISAQQAVKLMNASQQEISVTGITGKQLIDIRTADQFMQGHPDNAINIPVRNLLDKESLEIFDQLKSNGQDAVLYGNNELQATAPWLLLQQLGYRNLKLLKGGLTSKNDFSETVTPLTEVTAVDVTAMKAIPEGISTPDEKVVKKKAESVVPVKKAASSGGGC
jgi:rhodanese-related sulfurtransferase